MRKKIFGFIGIVMMTVMLSACGNTNSKVDQVIQNQMQEADTVTDKSEDTKDIMETETDQFSESTENLFAEYVAEDTVSESVLGDNIDLTVLSSTMVYSEVYNMMYSPHNYEGKTVKMNGLFVAYTNKDKSQYYPAVIIADATACCLQGLEFILEGNPAYPAGYPEVDTEITVVGTFETYEEDGYTYCRLQNAKIL
ncbi:MAG: hypothetical protein MJ134_08530 [Lachnospiraceae bacterium]|nr:hypothetical protein [Lachnospiraceae bacterium]